ncbi:MAG: methionine--tRNA ligase [Patescibacteria group bacterium]
MEKVFIGVAWPYVNGDIHVGHLAGYLVPCDIFARFSRISGKKVLMVSGTDCHGTPITVEADKRKITPQELVDEYDPKVRDLINLYGTSYDLFTTTTTENHKKITQEIFLNLLKNGYIIKKKSKQYFSEKDQKFLPDRYVEGECPHCNSKEQRADQCENCGRTLNFGELINPHSKLTKSKVSFRETEHYYIDFPKLSTKIKNFVEPQTHWKDWVYKETLGWLKEGLDPRPITRDIDWGIEIPDEQIPDEMKLQNSKSKRFYVWFEAVIGYFSASIEWSEKNQKKNVEEKNLSLDFTINWQDFWLDKSCKHYYFMGKDNLAFHTIFWPGQLLGQEKNLNLPYFPCVSQNLNLEGQKFSKSRGIYLDAKKVGEFFGVDLIRFYIASIFPASKDANWKWLDFQYTINNELAGNIGNFIHRTLTFLSNKLDGKIAEENQALEQEVEKKSKEIFERVSNLLEFCKFPEAISEILAYSKFGNQFFDSNAPWKNFKQDKNLCEKTLFNSLQIVVTLAKLLYPFVPNSANKILENLNLSKIETFAKKKIFEFVKLDFKKIKISKNLSPIFPKIENEKLIEFENSK